MHKDLPYSFSAISSSAIKRLFQNIGIAVLLNLVIKSAWILVNNMVQDKIGHAQFGTYMALYSLGFLFIALSDLGVNQYATKTIASRTRARPEWGTSSARNSAGSPAARPRR